MGDHDSKLGRRGLLLIANSSVKKSDSFAVDPETWSDGGKSGFYGYTCFTFRRHIRYPRRQRRSTGNGQTRIISASPSLVELESNADDRGDISNSMVSHARPAFQSNGD